MKKIPQAVAMVLLAGALACPLCSEAQETKPDATNHAAAVRTDAEREIPALLNEFLAHVSDPAMHNRFWADDVIYTGSGGKVRGKPEIMKSVTEEAEKKTDKPAASPYSSQYSAEDVKVRQFGDIAVLNFQLVAHDGDKVQTFRNSGTFVKRDGKWQVVNWQATKIAEEPQKK